MACGASASPLSQRCSSSVLRAGRVRSPSAARSAWASGRPAGSRRGVRAPRGFFGLGVELVERVRRARPPRPPRSAPRRGDSRAAMRRARNGQVKAASRGQIAGTQPPDSSSKRSRVSASRELGSQPSQPAIDGSGGSGCFACGPDLGADQAPTLVRWFARSNSRRLSTRSPRNSIRSGW